MILTGKVLVDDAPVDKAGSQVSDQASIRIKGGQSRFVSRGGEKLAGALADLGVRPQDLYCLDVGASTGGFTDCLLQGGARGVVALDVGHSQLHDRIRNDPRVAVIERSNARYLEAEQLPHEPIELVVIDVSFISATLMLPAVHKVAPAAQIVVLVKPQFEVGRDQVGKGGVVRDDALRKEATDRVSGCGVELGYCERGRAESRVAGPKGNREVFLWLVP